MYSTGALYRCTPRRVVLNKVVRKRCSNVLRCPNVLTINSERTSPCYNRHGGLPLKTNHRYLYKSSVKDIYSCLVKTSETPKCIEKWGKVLAVEIDTKAVFDNFFRTTREKCLIWFQCKLLYNLLPTGRFLFQRQLVDSPVCVFCKGAEETLLHMFWDCTAHSFHE